MTTEPFLNDDERQLLRKSPRCCDLTDTQFAEFMHAVDRYRLDPFASQIYAVTRNVKKRVNNQDVWEKRMTVQCGIDGYRLIADRTGTYAGNDDAVMLYGQDGNPVSACVTVYKMLATTRCPFGATARWDEYYPGDKQGRMWRNMPHVMIAKCAEALALRKAFPAELSGLYTDVEMQQADAGAQPPTPAVPGSPTGGYGTQADDFFDKPDPPPAVRLATKAEKQAVVDWMQKRMTSQGIEADVLVVLAATSKLELNGRFVKTKPELDQVQAAIRDGKYTLDTGELIQMGDN